MSLLHHRTKSLRNSIRPTLPLLYFFMLNAILMSPFK